jgi:spermidine synthase
MHISPLHIGVASVAAATLLYEVALTRLFSIAHGYHFAFLAVSMGLLGFGASGTALALRRRPPLPRSIDLARLAVGAALAFVGGYLAANRVPFDPYQVAWEPGQLFLLAAYLLSLAAPFLLVGLILGLPLIAWPGRSSSLYGANLAGSGVGSLLALAVLDRGPAPIAVVVAALLSAGGALAFVRETRNEILVPQGVPSPCARGFARPEAFLATATVALCAALIARPPGWLDVRLSPYKPLSQLLNRPDARVLYRGWNARSRIDVVESSSIRSAPGLSLQYQGPVPLQTGLVLDGEVTYGLTSRTGLGPDFLQSMPTALAYRLRPSTRALILEPGGGLDVLTALSEGVRSVTAVEENPLVAEVIRSRFRSRAGGVYSDPQVRVLVSPPRQFLARTDERFELIALSLSENFRTVAAGTFSLSEDYAMTTEAFRAYLDHLAPDGLLVIHRWLQLPPTEELRAAAAAMAALDETGAPLEPNLVAIRSFSTMLILVKREPFEEGELASIKRFAEARHFDLVYYPGMRPKEANRFNVLRTDPYYEAFRALLADPEGFSAGYRYDVTPATDDRPFFFHFFKWEQTPTVLALLGKTWQPFGGSGYLVVLALLAVVSALSAVLVVAPIVAIRRRQRRGLAEPGSWARPLLYFAALGLGFILVEVALIQRSILFLDYPAQAFSVVLFGILLFSGIGSALSSRLPWPGVLAALAGAIAAYPWLVPAVFSVFLGHSLPVRVLVTLALLAPVGLMMGVPFPRGLRALGETSPSWVPLAWGVNGFASVVSAIAAAIIALSWGFTFVFAGAALAYLVALAAAWRGVWVGGLRQEASSGVARTSPR